MIVKVWGEDAASGQRVEATFDVADEPAALRAAGDAGITVKRYVVEHPSARWVGAVVADLPDRSQEPLDPQAERAVRWAGRSAKALGAAMVFIALALIVVVLTQNRSPVGGIVCALVGCGMPGGGSLLAAAAMRRRSISAAMCQVIIGTLIAGIGSMMLLGALLDNGSPPRLGAVVIMGINGVLVVLAFASAIAAARTAFILWRSRRWNTGPRGFDVVVTPPNIPQ